MLWCCTDDYCSKQHFCCCSPSLFCRPTAEDPRKPKSLNPATQTLQNVFLLCLLRLGPCTHLTEGGINVSVLSVSRHKAVIHLLFSCSPTRCALPPSFSCQTKKKKKRKEIPLCTIKIGDAHMGGFKSYHQVVKNFKVGVDE